ncbi:hypothetical protein XELAEV_18021783mg [Xenopus laevis]|uniref:Uncharacterized protein n=1 Tax=Xenopus laevis TaxID=8355 RepID=A0A974D3T9_XENLA|nr:hypothetical protein XELAEV_18021783mg [Xenopus laevis]
MKNEGSSGMRIIQPRQDVRDGYTVYVEMLVHDGAQWEALHSRPIFQASRETFWQSMHAFCSLAWPMVSECQYRQR